MTDPSSQPRSATSKASDDLHSAPGTVPPAASLRSRRRLIGLILGGVAALGAVTGLAFRGAHGESGAAAIGPDVPRAEGTAIVYSPAFRDRAGIKTTIAHKGELVPELKVVGTVAFDPEHVAAVGTRIRGLVRKLVKIEGDAVKAGDTLAEIESAELGEAQASVAMIEAQRKAAELNAARERDLSQRKLSTAREAEVAEASLSEHQAMLGAARQKVAALGGGPSGALGLYVLKAPLSGTVVERLVSAGQSVEGNLVAYRVADLDHLWIELAVFERSVDAIRRGDAVEIRPLADPDRVIAGTVAHVGDALDATTRSAPVRVKIDNTARKLRPGQAVTASIRASGPTRNALSIPTNAVTWVDGKPTVFVVAGDNRVIPTRVTLGAATGAEQEIREGIAEGTVVVSDGVFALKSELYR
ncbi:Cobalt/zinc/cadmium efflux RND transporter [Minicystis rosea]|nr:Cobalt/zinc/cadmium efflux RND transporter [Minicystis rosea]